jgi:glutathione S-transferase
MKLLIGNKNHSSWSLRPWLLLSHLEIPFEEERLSFNDPRFKAKVERDSPVGKVPAMRAWVTAALAEHDFVEIDEPYRVPPRGA